MKSFNIIAITVFVGSVGFITYSLIKDSSRKYYTTTRAETATVEETLQLSGRVYPSREIEVKPQISGVVDALYVGMGDTVKDGDPIASVSLVPNSSEIEQLTSAVNIAQINLDAARLSFERQKKLLERKAISQKDYEAAQKEYLTADENLATALNQLSLRQKNSRNASNIVRSSASGVVIDIPVKVGSSVVERSNFNVGSTIATIAGAEQYIFKADVPEKSIADLDVGMPVSLSLLAYKGASIDAVITKISSKGEMQGGAVKFPVEAEFSLGDSEIDLRSGYSATARILLSSAQEVLTLPEKCINFKGDTTFVYVTDSLKRFATEKIVTLGLSDGERVQITEGITRNELIITNYHD